MIGKDLERITGATDHLPAHSVVGRLHALYLLPIGMPHDHANFLLQSFWYILAPSALTDGFWWNGDVLFRLLMMNDIDEADLISEL
jgi:hypothetical protein